MSRRFSISVPLSLVVALLWAAGLPAGAQTNSLTGMVRDSRGTPQSGAVVQLLRPDLSVVHEVYTDDHGRYRMDAILPGIYEVKASGSLFLPTLRENLRVLGGSRMVVNLTLNTLYEAFRWLPAKPRPADEPKDDWTWTLRLSANRPLLRLLQDGPLVVVDSGDGSAPELKARVTVRGGASRFGDGGLHHDFELERTPTDGRAMIFRADLSQAQLPAVNSMLGYEQRLAPGRTFRAIGAVEARPDISGGPGSQGLQAIEMRSGETTMITQSLQAEFGGETELVHLSNTVLANHPFAAVTLRPGNMVVAYRISTAPGIQQVSDLDRESTIEPALAERNGRLALEQGLHQEITVGRNAEHLRMRVTAWHERVENPVITGGGTISPADWSQGNLLYDGSSDLIRAAGPNFTGNGVLGEVEQQVNRATWISFDVALGNALMMESAAPGVETVGEVLANAKAQPQPMYSAAVRGKLNSTGTQWRASYRWQDSRSVTRVNAFATGLPNAYLSVLVRQPIRYRGIIPNGVEALVDVTNLLAEGYRPFVSRDGSSLYFAQAPRCIEGGLSFTF